MNKRLLFAAMAILTSAVTVHADVSANCTSYSKEYDFKIRVGKQTADVTVLRAEPKSSEFYLVKTGSAIHLTAQKSDGSGNWNHFLGKVKGDQVLGLNANDDELAKQTFTMDLLISSIYDDASSVNHQVDCKKN